MGHVILLYTEQLYLCVYINKVPYIYNPLFFVLAVLHESLCNNSDSLPTLLTRLRTLRPTSSTWEISPRPQPVPSSPRLRLRDDGTRQSELEMRVGELE